MEIKTRIQLDLSLPDMMREVNAKQGDDARHLEVELLDHGAAYAIPDGAAAFFRCRKPDGHSCYNPATISGGVVLVELTAQVLAVPGRVRADVELRGEDGGVLSAFCFAILVEAAPLGDLAESRDELRAYAAQLEKIREGIDDLRQELEDLPSGELPENFDMDALVDRVLEELPVSVGEDGYTDISGLRRATGYAFVRSGQTIILTVPLEGGVSEVHTIALDEDDWPATVTVNGHAAPVTWEGF